MIEKTELRKRRDFGENISTIFHIIRTEHKQFVGSIVLIAGPVILIASIAVAYVTVNAMDAFSSFDPTDSSSASSLLGSYIQIIFSYVGIWIGYTVISIVTYSYLKVYLEVDRVEDVTTNMVWNETKRHIFSVTFASIINIIVIIFCTIFLVIPGLIMSVYLSMVIPIMILEGESYGSAFNKSFRYLSNNFWLTAGLLIVVSIIASMISFAFSIHSTALSFVWQLNTMESWSDGGSSSTLGSTFAFFFLITTIFANLARMLTYSFTHLSMGLQYYNVKEQIDSTGLMEQIANMGTNKTFEDETY